MRNEITTTTISLIGGAALGAVAMYLLDPDQGDSRRGNIVDSAGKIVSGAASTVNSKVQDSFGSARGFAASVSQYAHDLADKVSQNVSDHASNISDQGYAAVDSASDHVRDSVDSVKAYANQIADKAKSKHADFLDRANALFARGKSSVRQQVAEPSSPYLTATGITAGTVGVLAIGAGLMYFLDPERGHSRRARTRDQVLSGAHRAGKSARRYGRHLGNQFTGYVHEAKAAVPEQWSNAVDRATLAVASVRDNGSTTDTAE